eukprot:CAMPEP_0178402156 /NCGR_PEP_ID=MMETSP0689_2-20121128/16689_1 /TAXON_ID=160604 /ORGANISM="Amphidinium massartii, Strain CS-259" /LENGTH=774 /DNA_ID=CAMNT_0020023033 /DNA_START=293 /DNA_END=2614 /DNA_ORIENTATION=-
MRAIDEATRTVANFIFDELGLKPSQVVWYGRSIGSGPATRMAYSIAQEYRQQPGGLIVQCGFANFKDVAEHLFGRIAKRLVSPLWPNEAMIKELRCPVLLIHGRSDKMIPLAQSEKLWHAVFCKDNSKFHICDCGHDNFPFQRSVLRPMHDFLANLVSSQTMSPEDNFCIDLPSGRRPSVHHLASLRELLPFTIRNSLQRPQLERWVHGLPEEAGSISESGRDSALSYRSESSVTSGATGGALAAGSVQAQPSERSQSGSKETPSTSTVQPPPVKPKKGKDASERRSVPNFCAQPLPVTASQALASAEGLLRLCAHRLRDFLSFVLRELESSAGHIEDKPMEHVVACVEALYWRYDPLVSLWEEVHLGPDHGVTVRLGPFMIDNHGDSSTNHKLGEIPPTSVNTIRVPMWVYQLPPDHVRYIAEWCLLQSQALQQSLADSRPSDRGDASCCCCFPRQQRRPTKRRDRGRPRERDRNKHPDMDQLASRLAAHFTHWVRKTSEVAIMFERFATVHESLSKDTAPASDAGGSRTSHLSDTMRSPSVKTDRSGKTDTPKHSEAVGEMTPSVTREMGQAMRSESRLNLATPPWTEIAFSKAMRDFLGERVHSKSWPTIALCSELWQLQPDTDDADTIPGEHTAPNDILMPETPLVPISGDTSQCRAAEWAAGCSLLEFERTLFGLPTGKADAPVAIQVTAEGPVQAMDVFSDAAQAASLQVVNSMRSFGESLEVERRRLRLAGRSRDPNLTVPGISPTTTTAAARLDPIASNEVTIGSA